MVQDMNPAYTTASPVAEYKGASWIETALNDVDLQITYPFSAVSEAVGKILLTINAGAFQLLDELKFAFSQPATLQLFCSYTA